MSTYTELDTKTVTEADIEAVKNLIIHLREQLPQHKNTLLFSEIEDKIRENEMLQFVLETRLRSQQEQES